MPNQERKTILCVGGLDPAGCAGITADSHQIQQLGGHAFTITSSLTVQTPDKALQAKSVASGLISAQLRALFSDNTPQANAAKIGLIQNPAHWMLLKKHLPKSMPLVIDPVLSSSSGLSFTKKHRAWSRGFQQLAKQASVITPNEQEWQQLEKITPAETAVLITGGGNADVLENRLVINGKTKAVFNAAKQPGEYRGTGCRLSSAIAFFIGNGETLEDSIDKAMAVMNSAISDHYLLGEEKIPQPTQADKH